MLLYILPGPKNTDPNPVRALESAVAERIRKRPGLKPGFVSLFLIGSVTLNKSLHSLNLFYVLKFFGHS